MNKNILIKIIVIVVAVLILGGVIYFLIPKEKKDDHGCNISQGYSWCEFKQKCVKSGEEDCKQDKKAEILDGIKKVIGLDLNLVDSVIKWNTKDKEISLNSKGYYYLDVLKAPVIMKGFENSDNFLKQNGFSEDSYNPSINSQEKDKRVYKKDEVVCDISRVDNPNKTSSLIIGCAYLNDTVCGFSTNCGKECNVDSDCIVILDGCGRKTVCRNKNYKFYNDCLDPSSLVQDIDFSIQRCQCVENQCVQKKVE